MDPAAERDAVNSFQDGVDERACERTVSWEFGTVVLSPSIPSVYDANFCRLDASKGAEARDIAAAAGRAAAEAGLGHVSIVVRDEDEANRLAPGLAAEGFGRVRHVSMLLRGSPPRLWFPSARRPWTRCSQPPRAFAPTRRRIHRS